MLLNPWRLSKLIKIKLVKSCKAVKIDFFRRSYMVIRLDTFQMSTPITQIITQRKLHGHVKRITGWSGPSNLFVIIKQRERERIQKDPDTHEKSELKMKREEKALTDDDWQERNSEIGVQLDTCKISWKYIIKWIQILVHAKSWRICCQIFYVMFISEGKFSF